MKISQLHPNMLLLAILLTGVQIFILWRMNGHIAQLFLNGHENLVSIAAIFSPTATISMVFKHFGMRAMGQESTINEQ